jgi:hypothetical protein
MNRLPLFARLLIAGLFCCAIFSGLGAMTSPSSLSALLSPSQKTLVDDEAEEAAPEKNPEDLVKDWNKPDFTLFVSGRQHGYIEPCGCITLARQKGGMMRRHRVQKILQQRGWDLVPIDAGNQVRRFGQQPVLKLTKTYEGLCKVMNYDAIGLGPDDLKLPSIDLVQTMSNVYEGDNVPFMCANVEVLDESLTQKFVVVERAGKRIGVTMVVGNEHLGDLATRDGLTVEKAEAGLQKVVPKMQAAKCDFNVLVAFTGMEESRNLAKSFPVFDLLVTAGGAGDPTFQPEIVETPTHSTPMIQVGVKGMYVGLVGVYQKDGKTKIKYERVALEHHFKDTEEIKSVFLSYQNRLKQLWQAGALKDITPRDHPTGRRFVGSAACADCHDEEYAIWEDGVDGDGGPHEKATRDLAQNPNDDRVWVQRDYDPECVSCHATGWNPQNFYPYKSGLLDIEKDHHLIGNGCENCHGPGENHVAMEELAAKQNVDETVRKQLQKDMVVTLAQARKDACKECHDLDNSPDFLQEGGFDEYWPQIEHGKNAQ